MLNRGSQWNRMPGTALTQISQRRSIDVTNPPTTPQDNKKPAEVSHPGMMGDGTEEQNLDQPGNPAARIDEDELDAAFGQQSPKK
jgi:hypothetical protein